MTSEFKIKYLEEPKLVFAKGDLCIDPKIGLKTYGPYCPSEQKEPLPAQIKIGVIGSGETIELTKDIIGKMSEFVSNPKDNKMLFPDYPGMSKDSIFKCTLLTSNEWDEQISQREVEDIVSTDNVNKRITKGVKLFISKIKNITQRVSQPDLIICSLPKEIDQYCGRWTTKTKGAGKPKLTLGDKKFIKMKRKGQKSLFDFDVGKNTEEEYDNDFRRALKAKAMDLALPTQIFRTRLLYQEEGLQELATCCWNLAVATYYKAGGYPWKLQITDNETCYVGISFYRELKQKDPMLNTALAQIFTNTGKGLVLKGDTVKWDKKESKSPHLAEDSAKKLLDECIQLFEEQTGTKPNRMVVHKTSKFSSEEKSGFKSALDNIEYYDFVALGRNRIRFLRVGNYPALRGTMIKLPGKTTLLYTNGYVPFLGSYPGHKIPEPLVILEYEGDSSIEKICREILSFTKMNWNNADFAFKYPITIAFSRKVGEVLSELPKGKGKEIKPEYKYYT